MFVTYDHKGRLQKKHYNMTNWLLFIKCTFGISLKTQMCKTCHLVKRPRSWTHANCRLALLFSTCGSAALPHLSKMHIMFHLETDMNHFSSCKGHLMRYLLPKNMKYEGTNWPNITKYFSKHFPCFISTVLMYLLVLVSLLFAAVWSWNPSLPLIWHALFDLVAGTSQAACYLQHFKLKL